MASREWDIDIAMRGRSDTRGAAVREWHIDGALARHATLGPFTRAALREDGVPAQAIDRRVASGQLTVLHSGVYALAGAPLSRHARHLAATLACGPRAVSSSINAAVEWALAELDGSELHVTIPIASHRRPRGITVHRSDLARSEVRRVDGLLLTSPARTLHDLAATHPHLLERAINEAFALRLVRPGEVTPIPGRRGAKALRAALMERPGFTRSQAERVLLALIARAGLPRPWTNVPIGRWEVDLLWPEHRLVVEVDGYAAHSSRRAFERDRRKTTELQALGHQVVRLTWSDLTDRPEWVVATIASALTRAHAPVVLPPHLSR